MMNKYIACILMDIHILFAILACGSQKKPPSSISMITDERQQDSIFMDLDEVTGGVIPKSVLNDSLAFLILPVQASCPSCRNKTIDSIVKHSKQLPDRHYIIISANGGRKTVNSYFLERDAELPVLENRIFLDSINKASQLDLYDEKPSIYYSINRKVYKKVAAIPATVREDLREFFSGERIK